MIFLVVRILKFRLGRWGAGGYLYFEFHQKTSFLSVSEPRETFLKIWRDFINKYSQSYSQNRKNRFFHFLEKHRKRHKKISEKAHNKKKRKTNTNTRGETDTRTQKTQKKTRMLARENMLLERICC